MTLMEKIIVINELEHLLQRVTSITMAKYCTFSLLIILIRNYNSLEQN